MDSQTHAVAAVEQPAESGNMLKDQQNSTKDVTSTDEVPVTFYAEKFGKPYIQEVLGIKEASSDMSQKLSLIENFVLLNMNHRGLDDTKDNYKNVIGQILGGLNVDTMAKANVKINALYSSLRQHIANYGSSGKST